MHPANSRGTHSVNCIPIPLYLLATFGGAWLIWLPLLIAEYLRLSLPVPSVVFITLGGFAPSVVALFLTWRYAGVTEMRQLLGWALVWRVSPIWYLFAIVGPAMVMLLAMGGHIEYSGESVSGCWGFVIASSQFVYFVATEQRYLILDHCCVLQAFETGRKTALYLRQCRHDHFRMRSCFSCKAWRTDQCEYGAGKIDLTERNGMI